MPVSKKILLPETVIGGMVLLCLAAFWATVPLPRVDGQLVGSDGLYYYVYLPSVLLDGDLDFTDEYTYFLGYDERRLAYHLGHRNAAGMPINNWGFGPALLWAPFFMLAHVLALLLHGLGAAVTTEGCGFLYQGVVLSGSILYGGAGVYLAYRAVVRFATERAALVAAVLVTLGGNLVYYLTAEPSMSHAPSAFLSGLFFYVWIQGRDRGVMGLRRAMLLGGIAGVMALVRPQDGLLLVLPFLDHLGRLWYEGSKEARWAAIGRVLRNGLAAGVVALALFSPQWLLWDFYYGEGTATAEVQAAEDPTEARVDTPETERRALSGATPYSQGYARFNWLRPKLGKVLISAHRGLLIWHPVFLLALLGLFACRKRRWLGLLGLLGFVVQWYVVSSWHGWAQGDAFGGRMFIVCTPFFMLGLAWLVDRVQRRIGWKMIYLAGVLLLVWNFLLFVEYRFDLVRSNRPVTWEDVTVRRVTYFIEQIVE